jgi:hypothetical protein
MGAHHFERHSRFAPGGRIPAYAGPLLRAMDSHCRDAWDYEAGLRRMRGVA